MNKPKQKLNPCFFCFSDNLEVYRKGFGTGRRFQVLCRDCGARGPAKDTESEAINEWNGMPEKHELQ